MSLGELLTRSTIWITIVLYMFGLVIIAISSSSGRRAQRDSVARIIWTMAVFSLIAHVACAFQFYHGWSHESAYSETARQTKDVVGLNWGGGLFINYLFTIGWIIDLAWWWRCGLDSYRQRPWQLVAAWHGFLIFIIFNSTVVFKESTVRWVGLSICLILCIAWLFAVTHWRAQAPITLAD
jgi:hypothetical protein